MAAQMQAEVKALHTYDTPEFISIPVRVFLSAVPWVPQLSGADQITGGSTQYLKWIEDSVSR
jgi:uncharacterized protein involved in tolerance to divalent cations